MVGHVGFAGLADGSTGGSGGGRLIFRVGEPAVGADSYRGHYAGIDTAGSVALDKADHGWTQLAMTPIGVRSRNAAAPFRQRSSDRVVGNPPTRSAGGHHRRPPA